MNIQKCRSIPSSFFIQAQNILMGTFFTLSAMNISLHLLFTDTSFKWLGLNPIALQFIKGEITSAEMKATPVQGFYFLAEEISHFQDVKSLLHMLSGGLLLSASVLFLLVLFKRVFLEKIIYYSIVIQISLYTTLTIILTLGQWKWLTRALHPLFFPQGNWQFSSSSLIIRTYPKESMQTGFVILCILSFVISLLVYKMCQIWNEKKNDQKI